jgi:hypothetical protein
MQPSIRGLYYYPSFFVIDFPRKRKADAVKSQSVKGILFPMDNTAEAAVLRGIKAIGVQDLGEVVEFLHNTFISILTT